MYRMTIRSRGTILLLITCVCHLGRLFHETEVKNRLKGADKGALDYTSHKALQFCRPRLCSFSSDGRRRRCICQCSACFKIDTHGRV